MQYSKLINILSLFSQVSLQKYLGEDLLEQFKFEWDGNNGLLTKRKLSEMLIQLNGIELLKNKILEETL